MMKKDRIFYLDFLRAIATLSIVLIHYNAHFLYLPEPKPEKCLFLHMIFNIYLGDFGVSLFFIVSGASLMYIYEHKTSILSFYKKRIAGIYPMYYMAQLLVGIYWFLKYHTLNPNQIQKSSYWCLIFNIIGFEQYFAGVMKTFAFVGEWFLGCIIIIYIIFPLLKKIVLNSNMFILCLPIFGFLYFGAIFFNPTNLYSSIVPFTRIPEVLFGMLFIKYWKIVTKRYFLLAAVILLCNTLVTPSINVNIQTTYVGICSFICLVYFAKFAEKYKIIRYVSEKISKYSYCCFLMHHAIINEMVKNSDLANISMLENVILFLVTGVFIIITCVVLYYLHALIIKKLGICQVH